MSFHWAPGVESRAHVGADPSDELLHPCVRQCAAGLGEFGHLLEKLLLLGKEITSGI